MIDVLLATYNARPYFREQLDSLLAQDCQDFQLLIRDGGSTDDTLEIIREYQERYPGRIRFCGSQKAAALENFSELLLESTAELAMFCDQDDVWLPQKISRTLAAYREAEKRYGSRTPILVFTDSCVTDSELRVTAPSSLRCQRLDAEHLLLNRLLLQNVPSGNTMLLNRALRDLALPIPPEAIIHDHWIALVAAALGRIVFLKEPTLYYRQHGKNVCGAFRYSPGGMLKKLRDGRKTIRERLQNGIRQAAAFGSRYEERLPAPEREMLAALTRWNECGFWEKCRILRHYRIRKTGVLRNLGMLFFL